MTRALAPISAHEGLARGALVIALAVGGIMASTADVGPPDYALPSTAAPHEVAALTGLDPDGGGGGRSRTWYDTTHLVTGDEFRVEMAWSDTPIVPPRDHVIAGQRLHECIRIVVSTTGLDLDPARLEAFIDRRAVELDAYLADTPRDPCAGRPLTP